MTKYLTLYFSSRDEDIDLGRLPKSSTVTFRVDVRKNGSVWPLTTVGSSVVLTFKKPDLTSKFQRTMSAVDASNGVFTYTTTVDEIDTEGCWGLSVKVTNQRRDDVIACTFTGDITFLAS